MISIFCDNANEIKVIEVKLDLHNVDIKPNISFYQLLIKYSVRNNIALLLVLNKSRIDCS